MAMPFFGLVNIMGVVDVVAAIMLMSSGGAFANLIGICLLIKGTISVFSVEA